MRVPVVPGSCLAVDRYLAPPAVVRGPWLRGLQGGSLTSTLRRQCHRRHQSVVNCIQNGDLRLRTRVRVGWRIGRIRTRIRVSGRTTGFFIRLNANANCGNRTRGRTQMRVRVRNRTRVLAKASEKPSQKVSRSSALSGATGEGREGVWRV